MDYVSAINIFWGIGGNRVKLLIVYFLIGCITLFIGQILNHKGLDFLGYYSFDDFRDDPMEKLFMAVCIIMWPAIVTIYLLMVYIPLFLTAVYKILIFIVFGIIALFKKEKKDD